MPSCDTYHLTWVSLTLDVGISSGLFQQSTAAAPYLERVVMCSKFISPYQHAFYNISQAIFLVVIALFLGKVIIFSSPRYILPSRQEALVTVSHSWGDIHLASKASTMIQCMGL